MATIDDNMTVEEYLTKHCDLMIQELRQHGDLLIEKLRQQYQENAKEIKKLMTEVSTTTLNKKMCVTLKCIAGAHLGQKFRLEPTTENNEDVFKIGRSTGRLFREKGVSLYKDKEISTTHAKIELRNGQVFFVDLESTNGSQLNGGDLIDSQTPLLLREGDVIAMGSTELLVSISNMDEENGTQL